MPMNPAATFSAMGCAGDLLQHVLAQVGVRRGTGHDHAHGGGHEEGGEGSHQAVPDGKDGVGLERITRAHLVIDDTHQDAAQQVHDHDHHGRHGIALHELASTVHGTVEVCLPLDLAALLLGGPRRRANPEWRSASMAICLPGMASRVKRAATCAIRSAPLVMTMNWMMIRMMNHDDTDDDVTADHDLAESGNHVASTIGNAEGKGLGRLTALVAVEQDHTSSRYVQRKAEQGGHQEHGGKDGELQGLRDVDGDQDGDDRRGDVQRKEHVQQFGGKGNDQHHDDADDHDCYGEIDCLDLHPG